MTDTPAAPTTAAAIYVEHRKCVPGFDGCYSHWTTPHCRADGMAWPCDVSRLAEVRSTPSEPLDVETAIRAIEAMKAPAARNIVPAEEWISVGVVRAILEGRHPILARLSRNEEAG